jgi:hypothetical protein
VSQIGAVRIAQDGAADVDEKWNQWGLVDVPPRQVIAAGNVIELVAEVAVAVVVVDVKDKLGEGEEPDEGHAGGERGLVGAGGGGARESHA